MKTNIKQFTAGILVAITLLFAACKKDKDGAGYMTVKMTDAPGDYKEVNVEIIAVEMHYSNGGWTTLATNAGVYDLLKLRDSVTATLSNGVRVNTGKVTQMHLILGDSNTVVVDSVGTFPLEVPSGENTGLKINIDEDITVDEHLEITLDFDAEQSVHITGTGTYMLKPVIRVKSITTR